MTANDIPQGWCELKRDEIVRASDCYLSFYWIARGFKSEERVIKEHVGIAYLAKPMGIWTGTLIIRQNS